MKKIVTVAIGVIIMAAILLVLNKYIFNTSELSGNLTNIKVNEVTRSVFYAPQYVAIKNGYFTNNGLEIELTTGQGADTVMTAVLSEQCDIGFAGPEASIYVYNEGKDDYTQVFAQLTQKDGSFLVGKSNSDEFNWEELIGKTIIPGRKGGVPYMTFEYVLKQNGINPETDVNLDDSIKFDLMAGAFASGDAEYVTLFEPTASMTEMQEKGYILTSVGNAAGEVPFTAYFAKKSYIENNSVIIEKFTDAIYEGQKWVESHSAEEIAELIKEFFPSTEKEILIKSIQSYIDIDAWSDTPYLSQEAFDRLQDIMIEAGELKEKVPYEDVVNNKYIEKNQQEQNKII